MVYIGTTIWIHLLTSGISNLKEKYISLKITMLLKQKPLMETKHRFYDCFKTKCSSKKPHQATNKKNNGFTHYYCSFGLTNNL